MESLSRSVNNRVTTAASDRELVTEVALEPNRCILGQQKAEKQLQFRNHETHSNL